MSRPSNQVGIPDPALDLVIARILSIGVNLSIGLLVIGVVLMAVSGISPLDPVWPPFKPAQLPADLLALRPEGFLWAGLVLAIATPSLRVTASLIGFLRTGERGMAAISAAILAVIALSVILAAGLGS